LKLKRTVGSINLANTPPCGGLQNLDVEGFPKIGGGTGPLRVLFDLRRLLRLVLDNNGAQLVFQRRSLMLLAGAPNAIFKHAVSLWQLGGHHVDSARA
jgi:hypothetical protein